MTAAHQVKLSAMSHIGDIIVTQINLLQIKIHFSHDLRVHDKDLAMFLTRWLLQYSDIVNFFGLEGKISVPMGC